jgi:hypothetical protein
MNRIAVSNVRIALAIARAEARFAKRRGNTYSAAFHLDCGRTLMIVPAPSAEGQAWVYFYQEEDARVRPLAL